MTQLTLTDAATAEQLKQAGLDAVEATDHGFVQAMRFAAMEISERDGQVSTDELRFYAVSHGRYPKHQNSWGSIFRGPHWREVGRKKSAIPGNHAREIRVWQWVDVQP